MYKGYISRYPPFRGLGSISPLKVTAPITVAFFSPWLVTITEWQPPQNLMIQKAICSQILWVWTLSRVQEGWLPGLHNIWGLS